MTAEFNRTVITNPPIAIFLDEVPDVANTPSPLCRSRARWHFPNGDPVSTMVGGRFAQQLGTDSSVLVRFVNASEVTDHTFSGLWSCRLEGDESGAVPLGIYSRGRGEYNDDILGVHGRDILITRVKSVICQDIVFI